tara:strand:+ start:62 stop:307 length:246 start_codon:yes stop_codon:yes gene_type:complete
VNPKPINRKIIGLLKGLTDDKYVSLRQRKHIEITGIYGGKERSFFISSSPSSTHYQKAVISSLKRFLNSLPIEHNLTYPYF